MSEPTTQSTKPVRQPSGKIPIYNMTITEVDAALTDCDKTITTHSSAVKAKLTGNRAIPTDVLRELARANAQKGKLVLRRVSLLLEMGEPTAIELIDKLLKVQPSAS